METNIVNINGISIDLDSWDERNKFIISSNKKGNIFIVEIIAEILIENYHNSSLYELCIYQSKYLDLPAIHSKMFNKPANIYSCNVVFTTITDAKEYFNTFLRKVEKLRVFL